MDGLAIHALAPSSLVAEALALMMVCSLYAKISASSSVTVEFDYLPLIQAVSNSRLISPTSSQ